MTISAWEEVGDEVERSWPVLICLLGSFRLLGAGRPLSIRSGGKTEALLCALALGPPQGVTRDSLLTSIWPNSEPLLAAQAFNSLVHYLQRLLGRHLHGAPPLLRTNGHYRLNHEAGVGVDVARFWALVSEGDLSARNGDHGSAAASYDRAVSLYRGDMRAAATLHAVVESERLRTRYLTVLRRLAEERFRTGDYGGCQEYAQRMLACEPCREDAHRLMMCCHVRRGERAQALRQYRLCEEFLRAEFGARPEAATTRLFEQVRVDPESM